MILPIARTGTSRLANWDRLEPVAESEVGGEVGNESGSASPVSRPGGAATIGGRSSAAAGTLAKRAARRLLAEERPNVGGVGVEEGVRGMESEPRGEMIIAEGKAEVELASVEGGEG